jgi:ATP-dependent Clp protease ATP-binding subunit ClpB
VFCRAGELKYGTIPDLERAEEGGAGTRLLSDAVTEELIARVVARRTGIAVESMTQTERERLAGLEEALSKEVVGQEEAVKSNYRKT